MTANEIFPNPTVKQVIFQIRFPNLFYLESRMGDYQIEIMDAFPTSALSVRKKFMIAVLEKDQVAKEGPDSLDAEKIWSFKSQSGVDLNVHTDSLDLSSTVHKTYDNPAGEYRFRELIQKAVESFLQIMRIPVLSRIGLRYIDECPVPAQRNDEFLKFYNTSLDLERFDLSQARAIPCCQDQETGPLSTILRVTPSD